MRALLPPPLAPGAARRSRRPPAAASSRAAPRRAGHAPRAGQFDAPPRNDEESVLDAFFIGRALAETLNERVGAALGAAVAEASKPGGLAPERLLAELPASPEALLATLARRDAELREEARVIQEAVLERAREARRAASSGASPATATAPAPASPAAAAPGDAPGGAATMQVRQAAESLREEVGKARAEARSFAPAAPLADPSWNPPAVAAAQPPAVLAAAPPPATELSGTADAQRWIDAWRAKQRGNNGA